MAVQAAHRIGERIGQKVTVAALMENPTVESLAGHLRGQPDAASYSPLIALQKGGGERPPLFCVHPLGGDVFNYLELVRQLGPGQPFYGLQAPGIADDRPALDTVEKMADLYLDPIREAWPGPYLLMGWSFGGRVALEIARRLRDAGETVGLLAVLDTHLSPPAEVIEELDDVEMIGGMLPARVAVPKEELRRMDPDARLALVFDRMQAEGILPPEYDLGYALRRREVWRAHHLAVQRHAPEPYPGPVVLFQAQDNPPESRFDPVLGWGRVAQGGLTIHPVPGTHASIVRSPQVDAVARILADYLARFGNDGGGNP
jgi:thioesterase domain-containing protein